MVTAAAGGLLDETHWVELKQDLPPANKGANTELARDLASLAVDGGLFVVGVEDKSAHAGTVTGANLTGLAQRVDAVARSRIDPPLALRAHEFEDPTRPGYGVLLVEVPPSGQAPHMVDHVYYGRDNRGKATLRDAEVRQIIERRRLARVDTSALLQDLADHDPVASDDRVNGHLYLVAHPTTGRDDALLELLNNNPIQELGSAVLRAVRARGPSYSFAPDLTGGLWHRRSAGYTSTSGVRDSGEVREDSLVELTIREDGGLALLCGRGTTLQHPAGLFSEWKPPAVIPMVVIGLVYGALALAGDLADRQSGYQGQWQIGMRLDRLRGAVAADYTQGGMWGDVRGYDRDTYEQLTESTTVELVEHPESVTERLVAKLLRGLVIDNRYLPLSPPV